MPLPTIQQVHINQALTDLSIAYRQENPPVSDILFPRVVVDKQSDSYYVWEKADLWRRHARVRSPGARFNELGLRLSSDTYRALQYATAYGIPDEISDNADTVLNLDRTGTNVIMDTLALEKDITFATDFVKTGVWGTDKTGGTDFTKWSDVTSDPSGDVLEARRTLKRAVGSTRTMRMVGLCGSIVETRLVNHPDAIDRIKYTQAATVDAVRQVLAAWLGLDQLVVGDREYTTSDEGAATATYAQVFDDDFLVLAVPTAPGIDIPAAGYTFAWNQGGRGDMYIQKVRDEDRMRDVLRGICHYDQKAVATPLGYFFSDCVD